MASVEMLWDLPPAKIALAEGEAHIWSVELDQPAAKTDELFCLLSADERDRGRRFGSEQLRARFIAARASLREVLGGYLGRSPEQITFVYGLRGKPQLEDASDVELQFNLSHSANLALIAVSRCGPVGVDVERVRAVWGPQLIANRFFSENECTQLDSVAEADQPAAFFNLWTRKEAWLKATGDGITESLDRVEVSFLPGEPARIVRVADEPAAAADWSLAALKPAGGFIGALAVRARDLNVRCWRRVI